MDPSPSGDAAGEGGVCDIAIDNKVVEDVAMDTGGDNNSGYKDESDLMNGDRNESDIATDMKNSEADIEDDGFTGFAPLTALNNDDDKDTEIDDDDENAMEDDSTYAQIAGIKADDENVEDNADEQVPDAMAGGGDEAMDSHVEADVDEEITGHGEMLYTFLRNCFMVPGHIFNEALNISSFFYFVFICMQYLHKINKQDGLDTSWHIKPDLEVHVRGGCWKHTLKI